MPASIIWPVAASHRHLFRVHGLRALRLFPAVVLLLCAFGVAAAEAPGQLSLEKNSFYLSSAGFRIQLANDPAGQKALRALPAHRFVVNGVGEAVRYSYAEPQHCVCVFVGTQQAYDRYLEFLSQPLKPTDNVGSRLQDPGRRAVERPAVATEHARRPHHAVGLSEHSLPSVLRGRRGSLRWHTQSGERALRPGANGGWAAYRNITTAKLRTPSARRFTSLWAHPWW